MLTEDIPLNLTHLFNKRNLMCFFDKDMSVEPQFYNYSSVL